MSDPFTWSRRGALYLHERRRAGCGPGSPRRPSNPPAPLRSGPRRPRQVPEPLGAEKPGPAWRERAAAGLACRATPTGGPRLPIRPGPLKPPRLALACGAPTPAPSQVPALLDVGPTHRRSPETRSSRHVPCRPLCSPGSLSLARNPATPAATSPGPPRPGFPGAHVTRGCPRHVGSCSPTAPLYLRAAREGTERGAEKVNFRPPCKTGRV